MNCKTFLLFFLFAIRPVFGDDIEAIRLRGTANGGTLYIADGINPNPHWVEVLTKKGQSANEVLLMAANALEKYYQDFGIRMMNFTVHGDELLTNNAGAQVFQGTETGLGITPAVTGLTVATSDTLFNLNWINPIAVSYDKMFVTGMTKAMVNTKPLVASQSTTWKVGAHAFDYFVIRGEHEQVSSSSAGVLVTKDGMMRDATGIPFSRGVMPNWIGVREEIESVDSSLILEQITRREIKTPQGAPYETPDETPFYQGIKCTGAGSGGIARPLVLPGGESTMSIGLRLLVPPTVNPKKATIKLYALGMNYDEFNSYRQEDHLVIKSEELVSREIFSFFPSHHNDGKWLSVGNLYDSGGEALSIVKPADKDMVVLFLITSGLGGNEIGVDWFTVKYMPK